MNDDRLKNIINDCIGNDDPFWNEPVFIIVKKILELNNDEESSMLKLLGENSFSSKQLFDINKIVQDVCKKIRINLDYGDNEDKTIGLPYNMTFKKKNIILTCPNCGDRLMKLMPDGTILHCNKCDKYFKNDNETVGEETISPYKDTNVLY